MQRFDEDGNEVIESDVATQVAEILETMKNSNDTSTVKLAKLMGDPDIQKLIAARERGEEIHIGVGKPVVNDGDKIDVNDMDNAQMLKHMLGEVGLMIKTSLGEAIDPLQTQVKTLGVSVSDVNNERSQKAYDALKVKFPYLDKIKPKMEAMYKKHPTLSFDELRSLVVVENESALGDDKVDLSSERPTSSSARPGRPERKAPLKPGKQGMEQMLKEATSEIIPKVLEENR